MEEIFIFISNCRLNCKKKNVVWTSNIELFGCVVNTFLIEANASTTYLKCNHNISRINITKFTEIKVPQQCSLVNEFFNVEPYPNLKSFTITTKLMTIKFKEHDMLTT